MKDCYEELQPSLSLADREGESLGVALWPLLANECRLLLRLQLRGSTFVKSRSVTRTGRLVWQLASLWAWNMPSKVACTFWPIVLLFQPWDVWTYSFPEYFLTAIPLLELRILPKLGWERFVFAPSNPGISLN